MIGQYLPQTNESATVPKTKKFSKLNKPIYFFQKPKFLKIFHHIESRRMHGVLNIDEMQ